MTKPDQLELDRWKPTLCWECSRLAYELFPRMAQAALEIEASGLRASTLSHLFSSDLRELPLSLNDDLLELFGRSERTLSNHFTFHGLSQEFPAGIDWECRFDSEGHHGAAWRSELHAFDYALELATNYRISGEERYARRLRYLIADWIASNPAGQGSGWEIQPLARRVRNWTLAADLARKDWESDPTFLDLVATSLSLQTTFLLQHATSVRNIDHKLYCARATLLASIFFAGSKTVALAASAQAIIRAEIERLFAVGRDEREWRPSTLLHLATAVTEWLIFRGSSSHVNELDGHWFEERLREILEVMKGILMPDGALPLYGAAPYLAGDELADLFAFASVLLGDPVCKTLAGKFGVFPYLLLGEEAYQRFKLLQEVKWNADSALQPAVGLYRLATPDGSAIVINGRLPLAPPDHHDAFSYELAIQGQRVVIDSGVYEPEGESGEQYFSSARAHNVLLIDGAPARYVRDAAADAPALEPEIWNSGDGTVGLHFAQQGFGRSGLAYQRACYCLGEGAWVVLDRVEAFGNHEFTSLIHFYPTFSLEAKDGTDANDHRAMARSRSMTVTVIPLGGLPPAMKFSHGDHRDFPGWYAPEFGVKYASGVLRLEWGESSLPWMGGYLIVPGEALSFEAGVTDAEAGWTRFSLLGKTHRISIR